MGCLVHLHDLVQSASVMKMYQFDELVQNELNPKSIFTKYETVPIEKNFDIVYIEVKPTRNVNVHNDS